MHICLIRLISNNIDLKLFFIMNNIIMIINNIIIYNIRVTMDPLVEQGRKVTKGKEVTSAGKEKMSVLKNIILCLRIILLI